MQEIPSGLFRGSNEAIIEDKNDLNDYEGLQSQAEGKGDVDDGGGLSSVFSPGFSSSPRADMYRAWVYPEMYPKERQPVLSNWPIEDLEDFGVIHAR